MTPASFTERETVASLFKGRCVLTPLYLLAPDRSDQPFGKAFCQGEAGAIGLSRMPMARKGAIAAKEIAAQMVFPCAYCIAGWRRTGYLINRCSTICYRLQERRRRRSRRLQRLGSRHSPSRIAKSNETLGSSEYKDERFPPRCSFNRNINPTARPLRANTGRSDIGVVPRPTRFVRFAAGVNELPITPEGLLCGEPWRTWRGLPFGEMVPNL
jgi:hypothetical protein